MQWELSAFDRDTERLVGTWRLNGLTEARVRQLFGDEPTDPEMVVTRLVTRANLRVLQTYVDEVLDLDRFDYTIDAVDVPA
jgi:hypothetical protein